MTKIRLGVIGTGDFAEVCHLPGLQSHPQAKVVALCGRNYERTRAMADRFSVPDIHTDFRELCSRDDLDGVTIVTQNVFHAEQAITALNHGKHVFCEKPLGMNVLEARQMLNVAEKSRKVHQVAFTFRYLYSVGELRRRLKAGDIGKPFYVRIQYDGWDALRPEWQLAGSGMLFARGSHLFDIVRFVLGPIQGVTGFTFGISRSCTEKQSEKMTRVETDDLAAAWFTTSQGVRGHWFASRITPRFTQNGYLEVIGDEGALKASLSRGTIDRLQVSRPTNSDWDELPLARGAVDGKAHCLSLMMRSFVEACLRGSTDGEIDASFHDGLAAQQCIEDLLESQNHPPLENKMKENLGISKQL